MSMLSAHTRKYMDKGITTYVGFIRCRHPVVGVLWTETTGVHALTKNDAKALAHKLLDRYHQRSHGISDPSTP